MALVRYRRWDYLAPNGAGRAVYAEIFDGRLGQPNDARVGTASTTPLSRLDLVFEAAALRANPGVTLLLPTADPGSPAEAALGRLAVTDAGAE